MVISTEHPRGTNVTAVVMYEVIELNLYCKLRARTGGLFQSD